MSDPKVRASVRYGVNAPYNERSDWERDAHPWTVTLRYRGRSMTTPFYMGAALDREPTAAEVLECLVTDASSCDNARGFEDWANDFGYDTDSREAERTYRAIERQTKALRRLLGDDYGQIVGMDEDELRMVTA